MDEALIALVAAGIGSAAALFGQYLAPATTARREHLHWVRDQRAALIEVHYALMLEAAAALQSRWRAEGASILEPRDEDVRDIHRAADKSCADIRRRLHASTMRLDLYSSDRAITKYKKVLDTYTEVMSIEYPPRPLGGETLAEGRRRYLDAVNAAFGEMRLELMLQPRPWRPRLTGPK